MKRKKQSIFFIVALSIIVIITGSMIIHSLVIFKYTKTNLTKEIERNSNVSLGQLKKSLIHYIESYDVNVYESLIENEMGHQSIFAIIVKDYNMEKTLGVENYYVGKIRDDNWNIVDLNPKIQDIDKLKKEVYLIEDIQIENENGIALGELIILSSDKFMQVEFNNLIKRNMLATFFIATVMIISVFVVIYMLILTPLSRISEVLDNTDKDGLPIRKIKLSNSSSEVEHLAHIINEMMIRIKKSTTELERLNKRFELTFDGIEDGIWDKNIVKNSEYTSKRYIDMLGFTEEEFKKIEDPFYTLLHEEDQEKVFDALSKHYKDPERNIYSLDIRMRCKDGTYKWIHTRGKAILDENNKPIRMLGSHTDITDRKIAEQKLEHQKVELETIFNNSKDGIAILDLETNFISFNDAYLEMTGFDEFELIQKSCLELTVPEDIQKTKEAIQTVINTGYIENYEKSCTIRDGSVINVVMSIVLLPDNQRMLVTTKDMTKLKLLEAQAKLASMGEMIGNIAHQWRQPLSVISSIASGINIRKEYDQLDENYDISSDMKSIVEQTNFLSKTIDDFKNFIKNDHNILSLSLKNTLNKAISIIDHSLKINHIILIEDINDDAQIMGRENELIQSFINFINNSKDAINEKLNEEDEKLIFISSQIKDEYYEVEIKDNGGGIPKDVMERIFEPYFTTKHQNVGTGLGLSIVDSIIRERYHGSIEVSNKIYTYKHRKYKGACFVIRFKIEEEN